MTDTTNQAGAESYPPMPRTWEDDLDEAISLLGMARLDKLRDEEASRSRSRLQALIAALSARGAVPSDARTDALCDSAYIAGAKAGYNIGVDEDAAGLGRIIEARKGYLAVLAAPAAPMSAQAPSDAPFQQRVQPWMQACFGPAISADREERNHRFLEEALELVQATGCTASEAHQLVDYVYGRPVGEPVQEVGGVMVTMAALCLANGLDMHTAAETELARIWTKVEAIRAKQAAKPKHSPLPEGAAPQPPAALPGDKP